MPKPKPKPMPAAEVDVTVGLVRALLADQHPDLAGLPVEFLANGWDNAIFRLGDDLLARMPRRELGARIIAHEQRWLPLLAPRLPIKIPAPERTGHPTATYPYKWSVVPYLPGAPAAGPDGFGLAGLDLAGVATGLGDFLAVLHEPAPADAPENPFRGVPLSKRAGMFDSNLEIVSGQVNEGLVRDIWLDALAAPVYDGPPVWLHGDLHPANILADRVMASAGAGGAISGIIDFGDITSGDAASDLSVAWMLLPLELHDAFRSAYGKGDDALWRRARGWALNFGIVFLAHSADNPQLHGIARRTLATVLADVG